MQLEIEPTDAVVLTKAMSEHLAWMKREPAVDPGGQCKSRIELLLRSINR